ncbi:hypothetical protein BV898_03104 [Hypsibius exemplaris]|uniref:Uncharacterized protein n=1 Tax=Hypsibius exemplaris TaxID=2072580 RepID=A0A1W0X672_HYPEX|nr:hypothetical protein BV898_03104 [Hypsibius exemplaris]
MGGHGHVWSLVWVVLIFCWNTERTDGFALRLYSSFGKDRPAIRPRLQPKSFLLDAMERARNGRDIAGNIPFSTTSLFQSQNSPSGGSSPSEQPKMRLTLRRKPWETCGAYEECKKSLISYLERILEAKPRGQSQFSLKRPPTLNLSELPPTDFPLCTSKVECMIRLYRSG